MTMVTIAFNTLNVYFMYATALYNICNQLFKQLARYTYQRKLEHLYLLV